MAAGIHECDSCNKLFVRLEVIAQLSGDDNDLAAHQE